MYFSELTSLSTVDVPVHAPSLAVPMVVVNSEAFEVTVMPACVGVNQGLSCPGVCKHVLGQAKCNTILILPLYWRKKLLFQNLLV
jgi:hypothetical protein